MTLRKSFALLALLALSACGSTTGERLLRVGGLTPASGVGVDAPEMRALTRDGAARMVLRMPKTGLAVTLLAAGTSDGVTRWRGTDNAQIYTRQGMVIGTRGLGDDLMTVDSGTAAALILAGQPGQITRVHRRLDGEDQMEIQSWICDIAPVGTEAVRVSETASLETLKLRESCHGPRGPFTNTYWIRDGRILQAWQFAGSGPGMLQILFLP